MKSGKPGILLLLFLLLHSIGNGQTPSLTFEQLPYELNWASKGVTDILQDHSGYIWIATWANLTRYDGYSLKTYRQEPDEDNGLKGNKFTCLLEDAQGILWIGTHHNGLYRYDRNLDKFQQYSQHSQGSNRLSDDRVWSLHEDNQGNLWIGTEQGLNRMNPSRDTVDFYFQSDQKGSLADDFIYSFAETSDHSIWVGCEKGLNRMVIGEDASKPYFVSYSLSPDGVSEEDYLLHNFIKTIFPSKREANTLWIGTSIGLKKVKYSPENLTTLEVETFYHEPDNVQSLSNPFVADLLEDPSGNYLWIATFNGLSRMDLGNNTFQNYQANEAEPKSLSNNLIRSLYKDNSGMLWVGTDKGVNTCNLDGDPFKNMVISGLEKGSKNSITNIIVGKDSTELWLGSYGGGINKFNAATLTYTSYQLQPRRYANLAGFIPGLVCSQDGWLWAATQGAGVLKVKLSDIPDRSETITEVVQYTKEDKLQDDYIMSIMETQAGDIWIGYWDNGLSRYNKQMDSFEHYTGTIDHLTNLSEFPVVLLFETQEGGQTYIWAGLRGGGLLKLAFSEGEKTISLIKRYQY